MKRRIFFAMLLAPLGVKLAPAAVAVRDWPMRYIYAEIYPGIWGNILTGGSSICDLMEQQPYSDLH